MARDASREQMGFYPAHPVALDAILNRIKETSDKAVIVDPCAGEGSAVHYLADELSIKPANVVACELDADRSAALLEMLPNAHVAPATDFQSAVFPRQMASFLYLNPPFDNELGFRGRGETTFLTRATTLLRPFGLMAFVLPRKILTTYQEIRLFIQNNYFDVETFDFPKAVRKFDECVVMGYKRKECRVDKFPAWEFLREPMRSQIAYKIRPGSPFSFRKCEYTDLELSQLLDFEAVIANQTALGGQQSAKKLRPPLELKDGHKALLLAAGHLNGRIAKPGQPPHVVRGTSRKAEIETQRTKQPKSNKVDLVTEEKIELVIRTIDPTGEIREITDSPANTDAVR